MADNIGSSLTTALSNLKNPRGFIIGSSSFDRAPSYISHQSQNSTASLSPDDTCERLNRERQHRRYLQKQQLMKEHDASRPDQQFDAQVYELEARIIEEIENKTLDVPNGTNLNTIAHDAVKKNWMEQGIWNEDWSEMPLIHWMHEESPEPTPAPETDTGMGIGPSQVPHLKEKPLSKPGSWDTKIQQGCERQAKNKPGDEPSRPFHQFMYQISKERERVQNDFDSLDGAATVSISANINTKAYENVKRIWVKRGIWNNQWGILPGMTWKHETPTQMPDYDCDLTPSPTKPREYPTFNLEHQAPLFGKFFPAQADGPPSKGGQGTSKKKRVTAPVGMRRPRRDFSRIVKLETSRPRYVVGDSRTRLDVQDQGTQDTGRRRSNRLRNRDKSLN